MATQRLTTGTVDWTLVAISAGAGALSGALGATGLGPVAQVAGNALISGAESLLSQGVEDGFDSIDYKTVVVDAAIGGFTSRNNGLSKGDAKHLMTQGIKATKQLRKKGLKKTAKYYLSQTSTLFFDPLLKDSQESLFKDTFVGVAEYYSEKIYERYANND